MSKVKMPAEISNDGREVWDWAHKLSEQVHKVDRLRKLREQLNHTMNQCGSCTFWMTSSCPKEVPDGKGRKVGPSMKAPKCSLHTMNVYDAKSAERLKAEIAELEKT